jgi:hypothetical protein
MSAGNSSDGFGVLVFLVVIVGGGFGLHSALWGEREGTIKTEDCRTRIKVEEGSSDTWLRQFTCSYDKSTTPKTVWVFCEAVTTNAAGGCDTEYFYNAQRTQQ